jgi:hypothetical protein
MSKPDPSSSSSGRRRRREDEEEEEEEEEGELTRRREDDEQSAQSPPSSSRSPSAQEFFRSPSSPLSMAIPQHLFYSSSMSLPISSSSRRPWSPTEDPDQAAGGSSSPRGRSFLLQTLAQVQAILDEDEDDEHLTSPSATTSSKHHDHGSSSSFPHRPRKQ